MGAQEAPGRLERATFAIQRKSPGKSANTISDAQSPTETSPTGLGHHLRPSHVDVASMDSILAILTGCYDASGQISQDQYVRKNTRAIWGTTIAVKTRTHPAAPGTACIVTSHLFSKSGLRCTAHDLYNCVNCEHRSRVSGRVSKVTGQHAPSRTLSGSSTLVVETSPGGPYEAPFKIRQEEETVTCSEVYPGLQTIPPLTDSSKGSQQHILSALAEDMRDSNQPARAIRDRQWSLSPCDCIAKSIIDEVVPSVATAERKRQKRRKRLPQARESSPLDRTTTVATAEPEPKARTKWSTAACEPFTLERMDAVTVPRRNSEIRDPEFLCTMVEYRKYRGEVLPTSTLEGLEEYMLARCKR